MQPLIIILLVTAIVAFSFWSYRAGHISQEQLIFELRKRRIEHQCEIQNTSIKIYDVDAIWTVSHQVKSYKFQEGILMINLNDVSFPHHNYWIFHHERDRNFFNNVKSKGIINSIEHKVNESIYHVTLLTKEFPFFIEKTTVTIRIPQ